MANAVRSSSSASTRNWMRGALSTSRVMMGRTGDRVGILAVSTSAGSTKYRDSVPWRPAQPAGGAFLHSVASGGALDPLAPAAEHGVGLAVVEGQRPVERQHAHGRRLRAAVCTLISRCDVSRNDISRFVIERLRRRPPLNSSCPVSTCASSGQSVVRELRHGVLHGRLPAGFPKPIMPPLYHRLGSRQPVRALPLSIGGTQAGLRCASPSSAGLPLVPAGCRFR